MTIRVLLVGKGSFLARSWLSWLEAEPDRGMDMTIYAIGHEDIGGVDPCAYDVVVNFAIHPGYRTGAYGEHLDVDLALARRIAANPGAETHYIMMSSRKVYEGEAKWPAQEDRAGTGEGAYGRNKWLTERALTALLGCRFTALRIANVAAFEYPETGRQTFMATVLRRLKQDGVIVFDMSPDQRRDFLPFPRFAALLEAAIRLRPAGPVNIGSGLGLAAGDLATWVIEGHGGGRLLVEDTGRKDEFVLDMTRCKALLSGCAGAPETVLTLPLKEDAVRDYFRDLGAALAAAP